MNYNSIFKSILEITEEYFFFIAQHNLKQPGPELMRNALKDTMNQFSDAKLN